MKTAPVSAVTIADVSDSITHEQGVSQESVIGPVHFGSTTKPLGPSVMFNYVRAVGMQSGRPCQRTEKSSRYRAAHIVSEASIDGFKIDERLLKAIAVHEAEYGSLKNAIMNSVVVSSRRLQRARLSLAEFIDTASSLVVSPSRQNPPGLVPLGEVHAEVWDTSLAKVFLTQSACRGPWTPEHTSPANIISVAWPLLAHRCGRVIKLLTSDYFAGTWSTSL